MRLLGDILKMAGLKVNFEEAYVLVVGPAGLSADLATPMPGTLLNHRQRTAENAKLSTQILGHASLNPQGRKLEGPVNLTSKTNYSWALLSKLEGSFVMIKITM